MAEGAKPSLAALLVGKLGKGSDSADDADGAHMCAQDIIDAIHSKDSKALAAALKDFSAYADSDDEGGSKSGEPGDAGAAAQDPNRGYSASYKG